MKSENYIGTPYCDMTFKRSPEDQITIRQRVVLYAQEHGIKPAARHYGCSKNTVKKWLYQLSCCLEFSLIFFLMFKQLKKILIQMDAIHGFLRAPERMQ